MHKRMRELQDRKFAEDVRARVISEDQADAAKREALRLRMEQYK